MFTVLCRQRLTLCLFQTPLENCGPPALQPFMAFSETTPLKKTRDSALSMTTAAALDGRTKTSHNQISSEIAKMHVID